MIEFLAWLIALPFIAGLAYLALEIGSGLRPLRGLVGQSGPVSLAILMPAHNEAAVIAHSVEALRKAAPMAHILVVADNCSDDTARLAEDAGAEVLRREDPLNRGKGFALACGRDHLAKSPPDAVLILDADCRIEVNGADRLAAQALIHGVPVQAANLLVAPSAASPLVSISNFAMLVKNLARARGMMRLGGSALLFGTGMAFPWRLFSNAPLATSNMVEDLDLGITLARSGVRIILDDDVRVTSPAASVDAGRGQRSRWEHGFLRTAAHQAWPLLILALRRRSRRLGVLGAHLLIPPLALMLLGTLFALALVAMLGAWSSFIPAAILAGGLFIVGLMLFAVWWREARSMLPFRDLLRAPLYILWKIPIYLAFLSRRQSEWNRTERE